MKSGKKSEAGKVLDSMSQKKRKYDLLIDSHSADLYKYACWVCKDTHMAEEVMQETFLRAWKGLDSLREAKAAKGWLFTIFRREFARQFERKRLDYQDVENLDNTAQVPADYDARPEAFALRNALTKLSADYSEPLVMQVIGGFSCDEIADILGISSSAVMTRLFRARKQLREILGHDNDSKEAVSLS